MRRLPLLAFVLAPVPAFAGSLAQPVVEPVVAPAAAPAPAPGRALAFTLRGGVGVSPEYFGSDDYEVGPDFGFALDRLRFGPFDIGNDDPDFVSTGFGLRGAFRYIGERDADDVENVAGLEDVDAALEVGVGVSYDQRAYGVFADLRHGFGGHEALVAELGMDLYARPSDRWLLSAGPRVLIGSDDYADTYFSTPGFEAEGGVISAGVEVGATYEVTEVWGIDAAATWERFVGDAEDSPITVEDDQYAARIGLTRKFDFRF
ncbi:MipA/OmpV family protein [Limimaricola pyoseonensis]|uniref:MltA-interacting protein MipA n=1 Tax=Limimaricola pyoseonensis TaxID=521013 RepID=A0A1G7CSR0_9RHOB|nr:MipA/OmpV family protein [Limimaricola pyoseonensis]SDE41545.1 MltA-interacting protein MipA [Limimaricola pyoseonensis]